MFSSMPLSHIPCPCRRQHAAARSHLADVMEFLWQRATASSQQWSRSSGNAASSWWHCTDLRGFLNFSSDVWKKVRCGKDLQICAFLKVIKLCRACSFGAYLASGPRSGHKNWMWQEDTCCSCPSKSCNSNETWFNVPHNRGTQGKHKVMHSSSATLWTQESLVGCPSLKSAEHWGLWGGAEAQGMSLPFPREENTL